MQTRLNSGFVEDPALGQALRGDNRSVESSFCEMVPEAQQKPAGGDALLVGKSVRLLGGQGASKNPGAIGARDSIEVDALSDNEKSGGEDKIATEIKRLKKD